MKSSAMALSKAQKERNKEAQRITRLLLRNQNQPPERDREPLNECPRQKEQLTVKTKR